MVENKLPFSKDVFINRPHMFGGDSYQFWKVGMKIFIKSIDRQILDDIINGSFAPKYMVNNEFLDKPWSD